MESDNSAFRLLLNALTGAETFQGRWRPKQEASLTPPCSNLRSHGRKCSVLKKVLATLLGVFGYARSDSTPGDMCLFGPLIKPLGGNISPTQGYVLSLNTTRHASQPVDGFVDMSFVS